MVKRFSAVAQGRYPQTREESQVECNRRAQPPRWLSFFA